MQSLVDRYRSQVGGIVQPLVKEAIQVVAKAAYIEPVFERRELVSTLLIYKRSYSNMEQTGTMHAGGYVICTTPYATEESL